ncbi:ABC transporter substrate-binding protein [Bosea sp. (in: a-proteobacteria)]|jgi:putative spermidine/putrescine transport system substrate-binding protein|uniref:ABC transporter substrate-binding protein n=1 Tax=Bosea sp. (in: a-proteobacteria) TaxID=1871050 RepID=UPI002DDD8EBF|nr:extracellular solute-binding protein [Bosea sp. (in: a-proteobacteria)]HEV2510604.1 extracellular solute-binding protein [Bosea sp. (in: a-proteobacteria)]
MKKIDRRDVLKGLAAGAGAAVAMPALGGRAQAQSGGKVVVGTWGGDYARLLTKNIEDPLLKPKGLEVVQDQAGDAPRRAKMVAERRLPRGTVDIQGFSAANMFEMNEAGVAETLDYSKIPNAKNLLPTMKYPYGIGHIYSGNVVIYNPKLISPAPAGFKDWLDPKWGNKIGFIDIQYQAIMIAASMAATNGASMNDIEKAKEVLLAVKKAGARVYPTNEAFAQAMKNEEVGISAIWKARVVQWQNAGIPCEAVSPVEGIPAYVSGFVIAKNAPNKDNAYAYMNAMLAKEPQEAFAVDMGYNGTVSGLSVAPDLQKRIGFTPDEEKRIKDLDYAFLAKNDSAMKEWWDKVFKG